MSNPLNPRRLAFGAARKFLFNDRDPEAMLERIAGIDRYGNILPSSPSLENIMSRSRDRILANLDDMYTEAFERAKAADDKSQMASLGFAGFIYSWRGHEAALEFLAGYLIEYSLSVDNIFVIVLIFSYFRIAEKHQHRVLFWGIIGALVMRGSMISAGAFLIHRFHWILYV